ncbi:MAG: D-aminopeptidase [Parvibaculaceae bacterium]
MSDLQRAIDELPLRFKGPGGAVAVVKDGAVVARQAWGYADLARHLPFTPRTLFPICSITKQFTCATLLDRLGDPSFLDAALAARLPLLRDKPPRVRDLCHNQSGLRDYWALTVLCGAKPEGEFRPADARTLMGATRSLHFPAGERYSYSNGNFRLISDLIEGHAGRPFAEILAERILRPAGMETARLNPETGDIPGGGVGYEGDNGFGFIPAVNRINWTGDAGIVAALDDMIAWERFIDATRDDADGLYRRLSAEPSFTGGAAARYGFGLAHMKSAGVKLTGHGGALRGWRSQRLHAAAERLSVVVLFNHEASAHEAAFEVLRAALGQKKTPKPAVAYDAGWTGAYHDLDTDLLLDISPEREKGQVAARFAAKAELLDLAGASEASSPDATLRREGDIVHMVRPGENLSVTARRVAGTAPLDITGAFHSHEINADFHITTQGSALFGSFEGFLGRGAAQSLYPVGAELWRMPCQRSMDSYAPGDWTLHFERDSAGKVSAVTVGCWLARKVRFEKRT